MQSNSEGLGEALGLVTELGCAFRHLDAANLGAERGRQGEDQCKLVFWLVMV